VSLIGVRYCPKGGRFAPPWPEAQWLAQAVTASRPGGQLNPEKDFREDEAPQPSCEMIWFPNPKIALGRPLPRFHSRSRVSSIATLPPFSTLMILWTGLNPVKVISTT
jgi:hypothetical protein